VIAALRRWARRFKRDGLTLWFARRDPATPWAAKLLLLLVVAYALSPIDLIPDFIPVLGWLDELLLLPLLIALALRLLPAPLRQRCRAEAEAWIAAGRAWPSSRAGAWAIGLLWVAALAGLVWLAGARP
jgi:uncharacterized membrane protein YkvA (DUF1232 family)